MASEYDCSVPPSLEYCDGCGFAYVAGSHVTGSAECDYSKKTSADPCKNCNHGLYYHEIGGMKRGTEDLCVQFIVGPSLCECKKYEATNGE